MRSCRMCLVSRASWWLVAIVLLCLAVPMVHAQVGWWGAGVKVSNSCSETVRVNLYGSSTDGEYSESASYTLSSGQSSTMVICGSLCAASLFSCRDFSWSYDAEATDCVITWSNSGDDSVCPLGGGFTEEINLTCSSTCPRDISPPESYTCDYCEDDTPSPSDCICCDDYSAADYSNCCQGDYADYRCYTPDPPSPPPPKPKSPPPPKPKSPPPPSPPPPVFPSPPPPRIPPPESPTIINQKPLDSVDFVFIATTEDNEIDANYFKQKISDITAVPVEWIDIEIEQTETSADRLTARRSILQGNVAKNEFLIKAKVYTNDAQTVTDTLQSEVDSGTFDNTTMMVRRNSTPTPPPSTSSSTNVAIIIGASVAGVATLALIGTGFAVWYKKSQKRRDAPTSRTFSAPRSVNSNGVLQTDGGAPAIIQPPTMPTRSDLHGSKQLKPATLPVADPFMTWLSEQVASHSHQNRTQHLEPWQVDFSQVEVLRPIGEGSFGRVYSGKYQGRDVAIKVLLDVSRSVRNDSIATSTVLDAQSNPILHKLNAEAYLMSRLQHPNIVEFLGIATVPPAILTELCPRGSLSDILQAASMRAELAAEMTWQRRLSMAIDAAEGLQYLHNQDPPIVHRDLKSPNMLVTADWRIKVSDFNLSKILDNSTKSSSVAAMNPRWLPPELLDGERGTQACDIFALGVVLWELMTLQMPWENVNPWAIVGGIRQGRRLEIPNRDDIPSAVPSNALYDQYTCLMQKCWAQRPGDRPKVEEVVSSLRQIASDAGA